MPEGPGIAESLRLDSLAQATITSLRPSYVDTASTKPSTLTCNGLEFGDRISFLLRDSTLPNSCRGACILKQTTVVAESNKGMLYHNRCCINQLCAVIVSPKSLSPGVYHICLWRSTVQEDLQECRDELFAYQPGLKLHGVAHVLPLSSDHASIALKWAHCNWLSRHLMNCSPI